MNPPDALKQDWHLYYHHTYMMHVDHGPVYVQVGEDDRGRQVLRYKAADAHARKWSDAKPEDLTCWWPRAGAFNGGGKAFYIGRRPRRSMKKSAADHYYCVWGGGGDWTRILSILAEGERFMSLGASIESLNNRIMESCAITKDLIIARTGIDDRFSVLYKGHEAGALVNKEFQPNWDGTPAAKMAKIKLMKEGLKCI